MNNALICLVVRDKFVNINFSCVRSSQISVCPPQYMRNSKLLIASAVFYIAKITSKLSNYGLYLVDTSPNYQLTCVYYYSQLYQTILRTLVFSLSLLERVCLFQCLVQQRSGRKKSPFLLITKYSTTYNAISQPQIQALQ